MHFIVNDFGVAQVLRFANFLLSWIIYSEPALSTPVTDPITPDMGDPITPLAKGAIVYIPGVLPTELGDGPAGPAGGTLGLGLGFHPSLHHF